MRRVRDNRNTTVRWQRNWLVFDPKTCGQGEHVLFRPIGRTTVPEMAIRNPAIDGGCKLVSGLMGSQRR